MSPEDAKKFYHFTAENLPNLLAKHKTFGAALKELEELQKASEKEPVKAEK